MITVNVLNTDLQFVGIIDLYKSLIWAKRYNTVGDCELYVPATTENLAMLQKGYLLTRSDDDMVCQIKKLELDTDAENGNYIIATGYDVKRWLDQRVVWSTMTANGNAEAFIRNMVDKALGNASLYARQIVNSQGQRIFYLGNAAGFTEVLSEQVSYKNIGEKVREYCLKFGWGYKVIFSNNALYFSLYAGTDRSSSVIFSDNYENLVATKYVEDDTNMGNVALVAGEGQGSARARTVSGYAEGVNRYEVYVDAKDISKTITWEELIAIYPTTESSGQGYISGSTSTGYTYKLSVLNVQVIDSNQLAWLEANFPEGQEITIGGINYYQVYDEAVADIPSDSPQSGDNVSLRDIVYSAYLLTRGYERLSEFGAITSFEGTIEPNTTFIYKQDYFLGDVVTVENEYGISVGARITEVIEVSDDSGYNVQPKFKYISEV